MRIIPFALFTATFVIEYDDVIAKSELYDTSRVKRPRSVSLHDRALVVMKKTGVSDKSPTYPVLNQRMATHYICMTATGAGLTDTRNKLSLSSLPLMRGSESRRVSSLP